MENLPKAIPSRQKRQEIDDILDLAPIEDIQWVTNHFDADEIHRIFGVNPYLLTNSQIQQLKQMRAMMVGVTVINYKVETYVYLLIKRGGNKCKH